MNDIPVKTAIGPYRIKVFPNSGHQYFDIFLKDLLPLKDAAYLDKLAQVNNNMSWQKWSEYVPWILYRYEMKDGEPLLRLCVETNLGTPARGLLFEVSDEIVKDTPDEDDAISPYASNDEAQIENDYRNRLLPLNTLPNKEGRDIPIQLEIHWIKRGGYDPVDVDLIVDLGNTRTVALLLETPGQDVSSSNQFRNRIQRLFFIPRGTPTSCLDNVDNRTLDEYSIIDSWMLLHRTQFYNLEPPASMEKLSTKFDAVSDSKGNPVGYRAKRYLPHTFVELSPALIGGGRTSPEGARRIYAMCKLNSDARFYLGSPKRYVWDDEPQGAHGGTFWRQIPNDTDNDLPPDYYGLLGGLFRYFMDTGGKDWDIDNPPSEEDFNGLPFPNSEPSYPRRDAVCWFALSILETAHRQINSQYYLSLMGRETLPRRLHNIRITYPAGWTYEERSKFFTQWQRAINLFTMTRFENHAPVLFGTDRLGGCRPVLADSPLDEAVCSQLPIIYSDVKTMMGDGQSWIDLYGDGEGVTVMNVDIGGGTTDMAIIRYSLAPAQKGRGSATLQTKLLFRDGCAIAGDMLVKRLIEKVLLPAWIEASGAAQYESIPDAKAWIARLFQKPTHAEFATVDAKASIKLARIVRLVFVPLVNKWLSQLVEASEKAESGWEKLDIGEALAQNLIDNQSLIELNEILSKVIRMKARNGRAWEGTVFRAERNTYVQCDRETIEANVDEVFGNLFDHLARVAGRFNCQLAIVSGKPSELPRIKERFAKTFPLLPQRIIHMKNFPAGDWYPFSSFAEGRINDAKTCTVVGASLYQDICNGNLPGMTIQEESENRPSRQYYWSLLHTGGIHDEEGVEYLFTPADYPSSEADTIYSAPKRFDLALPCRIGRQIVPVPGVSPDPVYEIRHNPLIIPPRVGLHAMVTLRWVSKKGEGEKLEIVKVEPHPDFRDIEPQDVTMRLNTMLEESHWLDEPRFNLDFA
jgi:hypothetical protein